MNGQIVPRLNNVGDHLFHVEVQSAFVGSLILAIAPIAA